MKELPLVSLVTVVFNGERTIEQTILSVINQSYENVEYIIIDGCSTDLTFEIINNYRNFITVFLSEKDEGIYDAMNKGIKLAKGELIGIINSDDWFELNAVEIVVNEFLKYPQKKIFHGDRFDIQFDGKKSIRKFNPSKAKFFLYGMTFNHPSMFVHREVYLKNIYNIELKALSDYEFTLKQFLIEENKFHYIPIAYVNYRLDGFSSTLKLGSALLEGFKARKSAKLNLFFNFLSLFWRFLIWHYYSLVERIKR